MSFPCSRVKMAACSQLVCLHETIRRVLLSAGAVLVPPTAPPPPLHPTLSLSPVQAPTAAAWAAARQAAPPSRTNRTSPFVQPLAFPPPPRHFSSAPETQPPMLLGPRWRGQRSRPAVRQPQGVWRSANSGRPAAPGRHRATPPVAPAALAAAAASVGGGVSGGGGSEAAGVRQPGSWTAAGGQAGGRSAGGGGWGVWQRRYHRDRERQRE